MRNFGVFSVLLSLFLWLFLFGCEEAGPSDADADDSGTPRIVNGNSVGSISEFPFAAYIEGCGGTFIDSRWVLSAAHCWRPNYNTLKQVRYGNLDYTAALRASSKRIYSLAEYRATSDADAWGVEPYDIVLVELKSAASISSSSVALLPATGAKAGESVTLIGWGATSSSGSASRTLRKVGLTIEGPCVATNKICTTGSGAAGSGDSGGGLFRRSGSRYDIVGITSTSDRSGWSSFTHVYAYLDWIKSISGITRATQLGGTDPGTCVDNHSSCASWAANGECQKNPGYMLVNCKKSCKQCSTTTDQCPSDPNKTLPGQCGCGTPDTDSDNDGTANCKDSCPSDPKKTSPGQCGCGKAEGTCSVTCADNTSFVDAQGYRCSGWVGYNCTRAAEDYGYTASQEAAILANCKKTCNQCSTTTDQCPSDPNKTEPGLCGCGVPEGTCSGGSTVTCTLNPYSGVSWSTWNQYKANFHTHTTNSDGSDSPSTVVNQYNNANYDILAITDHDYITSWTAPSGMLKVKGDEYSGSEHVGALFNFSNSSSTLQKGIPHIASQGGMCNIHHPGRDHSSSEWSWFIPWFRDYTCFGLEVFNQGDRYSSDRKLWDNINENFFKANGRLVWGTSDDDKHDTGDLFGNFQFVLMPSLSESNLRSSLKNGAFYFAYEPGRSGSAKVPRITNIIVDNAKKTITITATGANSISWIGPGTTSVATGSTFDFSKYSKVFVRAILDGSSGDSYTQPFGFGTK